MIAVEWEANHVWDSTGKRYNYRMRSGILLNIFYDQRNAKQIANVIVTRVDGDHMVGGPRIPGKWPKIIIQIDTDKLVVKGVHIPFEPHGAEK